MLNPTMPEPGPSDPSAPQGAAALDADALARLSALDPGGRNGVVKRVFLAYAGSLDKLMAQLLAARAAQDLPSIRHVVHTLKSSSASIGALEFSMRCAEVEMMIRQQQTEGLGPCLQGLEGESTRVRSAVQAMLAA